METCMSNKIFSISSAFVLGASFAVADVPKVAVDIAPVHSLVSKVMDGLGKPNLIIPAEASPHEYQLRPSEAKALQEAKLVFWIGEDLTPWLEKGLSTLAKNATITTLTFLGFISEPVTSSDSKRFTEINSKEIFTS